MYKRSTLVTHGNVRKNSSPHSSPLPGKNEIGVARSISDSATTHPGYSLARGSAVDGCEAKQRTMNDLASAESVGH
jgi:hypothetical protein